MSRRSKPAKRVPLADPVYNKLILEGKTTAELQTRNARRLRKLRFLPPELIEQIFTGTQDADLTVEKLCNLKY